MRFSRQLGWLVGLFAAVVLSSLVGTVLSGVLAIYEEYRFTDPPRPHFIEHVQSTFRVYLQLLLVLVVEILAALKGALSASHSPQSSLATWSFRSRPWFESIAPGFDMDSNPPAVLALFCPIISGRIPRGEVEVRDNSSRCS